MLLLILPACSEAILHAPVLLFLIWKDMIGEKKKICSFYLYKLPARDNIYLCASQTLWSVNFQIVTRASSPLCTLRNSREEPLNIKTKIEEAHPWLCVISLFQTSAEKSLVRSTAFKPVIPRSTSSTETGHNSLDHVLCPLEKARTPDIKHKQDTFSGLYRYHIDHQKVPFALGTLGTMKWLILSPSLFESINCSWHQQINININMKALWERFICTIRKAMEDEKWLEGALCNF